MLNRPQRSAIVVTSSGLGMIPVAGTCTYAATKAFVSNFAQGLSYEVEDKIDVVDYVLGEVSTKLMENHRDNPRCVSTEVAVNGLMKDIGRERESWGCAKHERDMWMFTSAPVGPINRMMYKAMSKSYNTTLERLKSEGRDLDEYDKR